MKTFLSRSFITTNIVTIIFIFCSFQTFLFAELHHHHQILDYLPPQFFAKTSYQSPLSASNSFLRQEKEDAQLVDALNHQLITAINGAQVLSAYLDADLLHQLNLAELTEEMTFLTDAYLQPALAALDDKNFHSNLLRFLPRIANDTAKLERLFNSLNEYLPPYSKILKSLMLKSVSAFQVQENCTKTISSGYDFMPTSIVLETGFEYHFHLVALYAKLLKVPGVLGSKKRRKILVDSTTSGWHSAVVGYPLANTEAVVDLLLTELLPPLNDLARINSTDNVFLAQQCTGKLLRKVGDCLQLIRSRLKALEISQMSSSKTKTSESRLLEKIEAALSKMLSIESKTKVKPK